MAVELHWYEFYATRRCTAQNRRSLKQSSVPKDMWTLQTCPWVHLVALQTPDVCSWMLFCKRSCLVFAASIGYYRLRIIHGICSGPPMRACKSFNMRSLRAPWPCSAMKWQMTYRQQTPHPHLCLNIWEVRVATMSFHPTIQQVLWSTYNESWTSRNIQVQVASSRIVNTGSQSSRSAGAERMVFSCRKLQWRFSQRRERQMV